MTATAMAAASCPIATGKDFYGALQWAVGLELFLLIDDPWRVFFTTDHPNGAPFTAYPKLFELLMSREARNEMAAGLSKIGAGACRRWPRSTANTRSRKSPS